MGERGSRLLLCIFAAPLLACPAESQTAHARRPRAARTEPPGAPQPRLHGERVAVDRARLVASDGDTASIRWARGDHETVRILGIDAPETRHLDSDLPYAQPFGDDARAFGRRIFKSATEIQLLRAATLDQYGRSLGYLFVDGKNYSTLIIRARLAEETVSRYGDNGFPKEAAEVRAAARDVGPPPFESPAAFRNRMREISREMKARGEYPEK